MAAVSPMSRSSRSVRASSCSTSTPAAEQITNFEGLNGAPAFSPDGNRLAFVLSKDGNPEIYVMDLGSRQLQRLTNHYAIDTEPFWGADGQTIYYTSDRAGKPQVYKQRLVATRPSA